MSLELSRGRARTSRRPGEGHVGERAEPPVGGAKSGLIHCPARFLELWKAGIRAGPQIQEPAVLLA